MSSVGPLVYAIVDATNRAARSAINDIGREHRAASLGEWQPRNGGFFIRRKTCA
jgi:predicted sugar kinase